MTSVFGSCGDKFVTWETGLFDENTNDIVRFTSADGTQTLDLCLDPVKGAMLAGEPVEVIDGVLQLPDDMFGSAELSADGNTYTITFPGQEPQALCVNPVKTVNGVAPDADGNVVTSDELGVETINGEAPDEAGNIDLPSSTTVPAPTGFHTITTDDGVFTQVCLDPVKTVNGVVPDADGNVETPDELGVESVNGITPDADGNVDIDIPEPKTVESTDGSVTVTPTATGCDLSVETSDELGVESVNGIAPDADGNVDLPSSTTVAAPDGFHTITTDDGVSTEVCLDPVKTVNGVAPDADGNVATGSSTTVAAPEGFHTITTDDGVATEVCLDPVKDVLDADGNSLVTGNVATLPAVQPEVLLDWDGAPIDKSTAKFVVNENLPVSMDCVDGDIVWTFCDGSQKCFGACHMERTVRIGDGALAPIVAGAADYEMGTAQLTVTVPKIPRSFKLRSVHSMVGVFDPNNGGYTDTGGSGVEVFTWWSLDGGATQNDFVSGGDDQFIFNQTTAASVRDVGEFEHTNFAITDKLPAGDYTFTFGVRVADNTIGTGTVDVNASDFYVSWIEMHCIEIPAP